MVTDSNGFRFAPRLGGYVKPKCVFDLTKKYKIVEVRLVPNGPLVFAYIKGKKVGQPKAGEILTQPYHLI
jgi:hypothetical protein